MLTKPLRPYQNEAVDKFLGRGNLLVAYEMGLGKTVIGIASAEELLGRGEIDVCMIVCPSGLRYQWATKIAEFADVRTQQMVIKGQTITIPADQHCVIVDGPPELRAVLEEYAARSRPDYVIVTYDQVLDDWDAIRDIDAGMVVLDEATAIKSFTAQRSKRIKQLVAPWRLALSGTPMENGKPEELFSIMQWVDEELLGRWDIFEKAYIVRYPWGAAKSYKNLDVLYEKLQPAISRKTRLDEDVAAYMPDVHEETWEVSLDDDTWDVYTFIAQDLLDKMGSVKGSTFNAAAYYAGSAQENTTQGRVMARQQAMQMLLDHPELVRRSALDYAVSERQRKAGVTKASWPGSKYCWELVSSGALDGLTATPKLDALVRRVRKILADPAAKVIIFSQYRSMLPIIAEALGVPHVEYHGDLNPAGKAAVVDRFQTDPGSRLFLSSHAGTHGVDLPAATHLINYDLAWSAGTQDQINARHVRASSTHAQVHVRNLVVIDTIEEARKTPGLAHKRRVGAAVIDGRGADRRGRIEHDLDSLKDHLLDVAA